MIVVTYIAVFCGRSQLKLPDNNFVRFLMGFAVCRCFFCKYLLVAFPVGVSSRYVFPVGFIVDTCC